jgi:hypothetical protein
MTNDELQALLNEQMPGAKVALQSLQDLHRMTTTNDTYMVFVEDRSILVRVNDGKLETVTGE